MTSTVKRSPRCGEGAVPPSPDRASAADLMQFATGDGRAAGHIGAVLVLDVAQGFSADFRAALPAFSAGSIWLGQMA